MESILFAADMAQAKLNHLLPKPVTGPLILTLLFWRISTARWLDQVASISSQGPDNGARLAALPIQFTPATLFQACHWTSKNDAGPAIAARLTAWASVQANGILKDALLPERFGEAGQHADFLLDNPLLAEIMILFDDLAIDAELDFGMLFDAAMSRLGMDEGTPPPALARLMADLLQPGPNQTVYDPNCGHGSLLLAAHRTANGLQLFGQESQLDAFALAKLRMLAHGLHAATLHKGDALHQPLLEKRDFQMHRFDHLLSWIPAKQPEWRYGLAENDRYRRFPVGPPQARGLAQIWHNLASLALPHGRTVLLVAAELLVNDDSAGLRQFLCNNWLDALIAVPASLWPAAQTPLVLLVLCKHRPRQSINLIRPADDKGTAWDANAILAAWAAAKIGQAHPCLQALRLPLLKAHGYRFDWTCYRTAGASVAVAGEATTIPLETTA